MIEALSGLGTDVNQAEKDRKVLLRIAREKEHEAAAEALERLGGR